MHHWTGAGWTVENVGVADELASIVAADRSNIAVASQGNAVYRWNGSTWTKQTVPGANSIRGLALGSSVEVWCARSGRLAVRWSDMEPADVGTRNFLAGIIGVPSDYWVYGQGHHPPLPTIRRTSRALRQEMQRMQEPIALHAALGC